jgi:hypothetical protein
MIKYLLSLFMFSLSSWVLALTPKLYVGQVSPNTGAVYYYVCQDKDAGQFLPCTSCGVQPQSSTSIYQCRSSSKIPNELLENKEAMSVNEELSARLHKSPKLYVGQVSPSGNVYYYVCQDKSTGQYFPCDHCGVLPQSGTNWYQCNGAREGAPGLDQPVKDLESAVKDLDQPIPDESESSELIQPGR